jgi:hypothetical protein
MMGLLGKLIVHSRLLGAIHPDVRNQAQDEERRASSFGSFKPPG